MSAFFNVSLGQLAGLLWPRKPALVLEGHPAEPGAVDAAVDAALADFRAGQGARTRCPDCAVLIVLTYDSRGARSGSTHAESACACGKCDGTYEMLDRP